MVHKDQGVLVVVQVIVQTGQFVVDLVDPAM
jgi:hypothetical protein